jgi:tRNA 2-selenouridine synthase
MIISIDDFFTLRKALPVVDVRSEGEFSEGHIPQALNIPLLNNAERVAVGTDYKQKGQAEAIKTGFRLVGPRLIDLITETEQVAGQKKEIVVHCWRGGMRSAHFCQFVEMAGLKTHQLKGGYKSYRQRAMESFRKPFSFMIVGGCTGSGKSEILRGLARAGEQVIDLEKLASHKGSVFGGLMMPPQPTTEQFQNNLFEEILTLDIGKRIWIEDESVAIGKIFLPTDLWETMCKSPVIEMDVPREIRVQRLVAEYGKADSNEFLEAMRKITKRLGGQHYKAAVEKLGEGDMTAVIDILLTYYDKAYLNGLSRKKDRTIASLEWDGDGTDSIVDELMKTQLIPT